MATIIIDSRDLAERIKAAGGDPNLASAITDAIHAGRIEPEPSARADLDALEARLLAAYWKGQVATAALVIGSLTLIDRLF